MYAYSEEYLWEVRENLAEMIDYAVYSLNFTGETFLNLFISSGMASEIEGGNPKYLVGMSGIELARVIVESTYGKYPNIEKTLYLDYSPEYWGMWALTYYQWHRQIRFEQLLKYVSWEEMMGLYPTLHEADILKFMEVMDMKIEHCCNNQETSLARIRRLRGYSQKLLAEKSGVSLRMIQLYEQRQKLWFRIVMFLCHFSNGEHDDDTYKYQWETKYNGCGLNGF